MSGEGSSDRGRLGALELAGVGHRITHEDDLPDPRQIALLATRLGARELCRRKKQGPLVTALVSAAITRVGERLLEEDEPEPNECPDPCGEITVGSPNTFIGPERRMVALVAEGEVPCDKHADKPIRMGSPDVFVNGKPVARRTDETECGAYVGEGEPTIFIGAQTEIYSALEGGPTERLLQELSRRHLSKGAFGLGPDVALEAGAALAGFLGTAADGVLPDDWEDKAHDALDEVTDQEIGQMLLDGDFDGAVDAVKKKVEEIKDKLPF